MSAGQRQFEILCEIEPATGPDLAIVREQIAVLRRSCDAFLVPDSHLGRATVSSIAVAHEVGYLGAQAVACLNARDRNVLGLRRDLLTAAAYGVRDLLFVFGDAPSEGDRSTLTVKGMLEQVRGQPSLGLRVGVVADPRRRLPGWKLDADFACLQVSFDIGAATRWREDTGFAGRAYAGVIVLASEKMGRRLMDFIPGLAIPDELLRQLGRDRSAGVKAALEQMAALRDTGAVDGVHLVPARRYREVAVALEDFEG